MFEVVKNLKAAGCPIGGVAMKIEIDLNYNMTMLDGVKENIKRYGDEQLYVHMTEVEVRCMYDPETEDTCREWTCEEEEIQASLYAILLEMCLDADNCTAFEFKDVSEKYRPDHVHGLLFDEENNPKEAFNRLISVLNRQSEQ